MLAFVGVILAVNVIIVIRILLPAINIQSKQCTRSKQLSEAVNKGIEYMTFKKTSKADQ